MDLIDGTSFRAIAAAGLALLLAQGIPRAFRTVYSWTAAALFSSLKGRRRTAAMLFAGASFLWVLVVAGAIYTPLTAFAPRVLPFPGGLVRWVIELELLALAVAVPATVGVAEAYLSSGSVVYRLSMIPRAFVHVVGIALALTVLIPWIVARWLFVRLKRMREQQLRIDIDPEMYDSVTDALLATLGDAGLPGYASALPAPARLSRFFLHSMGPPMLRPAAEYEARRIIGDRYTLLVFDGLIDSIADRDTIGRVRHGLVGSLPPKGLWLTQSEGARELETLIRTEGANLNDIPRRIAEVDATEEEWRILSWEYMQVLAHRSNEQSRTLGPGGHEASDPPTPTNEPMPLGEGTRAEHNV